MYSSIKKFCSQYNILQIKVGCGSIVIFVSSVNLCGHPCPMDTSIIFIYVIFKKGINRNVGDS